jgi:hypothetical protein
VIRKRTVGQKPSRRSTRIEQPETVCFDAKDSKRTEIYHQEKREFGRPVSACWSPDGKRIAMIVHDWERTEDGKLTLTDPEKGNYRIMIMDAQGHNSKQLELKNARLVTCNTLEWR